MSDDGKLKVLVVDDEKSIGDLLSRILRLKDAEVKFVDSGFKAIEMVKQEKFDLTFLDAMMPVMNGLDVYRRLKDIAPDSRYAMMSGYTMGEMLRQAKEEGIADFFEKPFHMDKLFLLVDECAQKKRDNGAR